MNNLGNIPRLSENISTSVVHMMGMIRFLSFVSKSTNEFKIYKNVSFKNKQMKNKSEYLAIMDFINARKHKSDDEIYNEIRRQKYRNNLIMMTLLYAFGYFTIITFFAFPLIECAVKNSYNFPQPLYIPIEFANHSLIIYGVTYIFLCFAIHNSGVLVITTCMFHNSIAEFLTTEFHILGISFEKALEKENDVKNYKNLIKHHQELLRLSTFYYFFIFSSETSFVISTLL